MCGSAGLTQSTPGNYGTTLPHRTTFTTKTVPEAEAALNNGIEQKMRHLIEETGATILSDGWKSTSNRPIINVLASTQGLTQLKKAVDTSGHEKSMQFIFETVDEVIKDIGPKHVFAACMDGACKGAFALIKEKYEQIQCFVCPSHGADGFLKNACSDKRTIRMQANEVGGIGMQMMEWDVSFFHDSFNNAWQVIKRVVRHEKAIAIFRKIAKELKPEGGAEPKFFGETRYGSRVAMAERMLGTRAIYERLFIDTDLRAWINKQDAKKRVKVSLKGCIYLDQFDF